MKAVIIEDNLVNTWDYEMILDKLEVQVSGVYKSWKKAIAGIKNDLPDLMIVDLFLDHNEKGLDFIHEMKDFCIPTIICSAYPEQNYMDDALEAGVVAFISKPVDKAILTYQIKRVIRENESSYKNKNYLVIKDKRNLVKIPFLRIFKIEIDGNYSYIYLDSGKKFILKLSLKKLNEQLDPNKFVRCHRSSIVNLDFVDSLSLEENKILLRNGTSLQIGMKYKRSIRIMFTNK